MRQKLVIVGLGHVGLPLALRATEAGYDVTGLEVDEHRVKLLEAGESYVEDVSQERLRAVLDDGQFRPTADPRDASGFDIGVITVPTPLLANAPDLSLVEQAGRTIASHLQPGALVILESTTYPGTTEEVLRPLLETVSGLRASQDFFLGYSPERIDPGNNRWRLENTPKVVSGVDQRSLRLVTAFYHRLVDRTVPVSSPRTAELTKLLENTFRQVNVALVNELATVARDLGVNLWEAVDAAATKPFGYLPFWPGPGVGGHCLPTDPTYLSWKVNDVCGRPLRLVELANQVNTAMPAHIVRRVEAGLAARGHQLIGARVLLLGLTYKKNTGDLRESPALAVAHSFNSVGAIVRAIEPFAPADQVPPYVRLVPWTDREIGGSDAIVLLTDHDIFDYQTLERSGRYIFDARNRCRGDGVERL